MPVLLEVIGLTKRFPGVLALDNVNLTLNRGEVLAVIGENGAGKSTLMKILAGVERPDSGSIRLDGQPVHFDSVRDALNSGVALIHQELNLCDNLNVGANIFLGREPRLFGFVNYRQVSVQSEPLIRSLGLECSPRTLVSDLSIGRQQMVEIAKALSVHARVLIMDEPTSSLTGHETEQLFRVIRDLRGRGVSVVYISHRLGEVKALADRVVVLRDGRNAGELWRNEQPRWGEATDEPAREYARPTENQSRSANELSRTEISHDNMVRLMIGRDLSQFYQRRPHEIGAPLLEVESLRTPVHPTHALNFSVRTGEIVGIAGLVGAGRTELLRTLFGIDQPLDGSVRLNGEPVELRSPGDAIRAGIALVPEDRKQQGVILEMAVRENISLAGLRQNRVRGIFRNRAVEEQDTKSMIDQLRIKTPHDRQLVQFLSGGNQQKVALGKWLPLKPRLLLLDEPTRGIDIGAKQEIYRLMEELAESGVAIVFVSSEMPEILGMSDRVLVMHQGQITGELSREELSEEAVMQLATGGTQLSA